MKNTRLGNAENRLIYFRGPEGNNAPEVQVGHDLMKGSDESRGTKEIARDLGAKLFGLKEASFKDLDKNLNANWEKNPQIRGGIFGKAKEMMKVVSRPAAEKIRAQMQRLMDTFRGAISPTASMSPADYKKRLDELVQRTLNDIARTTAEDSSAVKMVEGAYDALKEGKEIPKYQEPVDPEGPMNLYKDAIAGIIADDSTSKIEVATGAKKERRPLPAHIQEGLKTVRDIAGVIERGEEFDTGKKFGTLFISKKKHEAFQKALYDYSYSAKPSAIEGFKRDFKLSDADALLLDIYTYTSDATERAKLVARNKDFFLTKGYPIADHLRKTTPKSDVVRDYEKAVGYRKVSGPEDVSQNPSPDKGLN